MSSVNQVKSNTKEKMDYDLIVIGSGPAGIHAAVQAAKLNKRVCIIEKNQEKIGGCWIHTGTLPSKTLRESLATIQSIRNHVGGGWVDRIVTDLQTGKLLNRAFKVSLQEETLIRKHLKNNKIEIIWGYGLLESRFQVRVLLSESSSKVISSDYILIATGSKPRRPDEIPFDGWRVCDSDDILQLKQIPKSMVIYGAGVVGCEYACIFSALGVKVTVIDSRSRILQYLDLDIVTELQKTMESLGIEFILGQTLQHVEAKGPKVNVFTENHNVSTEVLFYAAGRVSSTDCIGLERLNIATNDRGAIVVNENFQTSISNIYAAGDAIGPPALASTSSVQGRHVACHAFGAIISEFPKIFPVGVYTIPELSMVGKTEDELKKEGIEYVVGKAIYGEIARGYIRGDSHGLLKLLICVKTHHILGIHIVGDDACNLIHIGLAFMQKNGFAQDFINMVFNYPTLAEGYRIAAFNGLNKIFKDGVIKSPGQETIETSVKMAKSS